MSNKQTELSTDVVIVGGGLVGMATALKLAENGMSVIMLEAKLPDLNMHHDSYDSRTLVVNPASKAFWQQLGIWKKVETTATAINQVHVSNQGQFGNVLFDHNELEVMALGHVIEAHVLGAVLWEQLKQNANIKVLAPATMLDFSVAELNVDVLIESQGKQRLKAQLMVAADGAQSAIRTKLDLPFTTKSYDKSAVICNISTEQAHQNKAYERLTKSGPFALLPFKDRYGLVWSNSNERTDELMAMSEHEFMAQAKQAFGCRQGLFTQMGQRHRYPLFKIQVEKQFQPRIVLMGNAAHTVSPVSAQGLNLAIRGVKRLCKLLQDQFNQGGDLGSEALLSTYQTCSQADQDQIMAYTDDLMTWFKIDEPIINTIRSLSLVAIDSQIGLKKKLFSLAGGLNH
ncbi:FAD-dependent oxidoreductase [Marinicella litoralis]|uniref:2-octaprenyl-6-methoxyphenol hydroxylase /2-octaprenyl-3-methyl-6-methoxy-1,4-benzoquinol hydroxylase n=1 Tax=Marinicella litoralis TaxID=644220 RepID=A0A4R6XF32_9GAMM|nr:FAD-dependent oxidoreductase [Marinicella litoralis]TDR16839.1 2-octaprenyl-6-methoxyphenol hydroxylase /2-octaprenyl-3-methyl-6-methoxy-1,4-benzoquinol hydroxylase [Marinicella litoralis]